MISLQRILALLAVVEAAKDAPDWMMMPGAGVEEREKGKRIAEALTRLSELEDHNA